jgi:prepilin-type N-terminal cleavage/methylation domain-containing protein
MKIENLSNRRGVTLIELLVALVISAIVVAGIYRLFILQTKTYAVQDEVVEVQQNVRSAMEILLRDIRMGGFNDEATPLVTVTHPAVVPGDNAITVRYEHNAIEYQVDYWVDATLRLNRRETQNGIPGVPEFLLENVGAFDFTYSVDEDGDGAMDDLNANGVMDDWISAAAVGSSKVVAVRVGLTANPVQVNPDLRAVSPRRLASTVTLRNMTFTR